VRHGGLGIRDPTATAVGNHQASVDGTKQLVEALLSNSPLDIGEYHMAASSTKAKLRAARDKADKLVLQASLAATANPVTKRVVKRAGFTGAWLTVIPSRVNGTELTADEFRDPLNVRYNLRPPHTPKRCDGCGKPFTLAHAFTCPKGGLPILRHDLVKKEWNSLCSQAISSSKVFDEPPIHTGRADLDEPALNAGERSQERGDIGVVGFWKQRRMCIFDVRVTHLEISSNMKYTVQTALKIPENEKKARYLEACEAMRRDFVPLVFSADGMFSPATLAAVKRLSQLLSEKWEAPFSVCCGYVRSRLSLCLARSLTMCLRDPRTLTSTQPEIPVTTAAGLQAMSN